MVCLFWRLSQDAPTPIPPQLMSEMEFQILLLWNHLGQSYLSNGTEPGEKLSFSATGIFRETPHPQFPCALVLVLCLKQRRRGRSLSGFVLTCVMQRAQRWAEQMDALGEQRLRLAATLMDTLGSIETESGVFLIKPAFSYKSV